MSAYNSGSGWIDEGDSIKRFTKAPERFLGRLNLEVKDLLATRKIGDKPLCQRCFNNGFIVCELETKLVTFVCRECRIDTQEWDYQKRLGGVSYSLQGMVNEMPESEVREDGSGY